MLDILTQENQSLVHAFFQGGNGITWISKKQNIVSRSSAEYEYSALVYLAAEGGVPSFVMI